jgi:hypothetical protein
MKEKPILFSGEMVRAILDGRKTQTRRVIAKPKDINWFPNSWKSAYQDGDGNWIFWTDDSPGHAAFTKKAYPKECNKGIKCPFGQAGDRLWVRETFGDASGFYAENDCILSGVVYRADDTNGAWTDDPDFKWRPSIHMPRAASRINLEITDVRVQRLQDISEQDAIAEGLESFCPGLDYPRHELRTAFQNLWDSNNKKHPWASNPWVWVLEFKLLR